VTEESGIRPRLVRLLQLAYSGELAAALAYQGHARSVQSAEERAMITRIEKDEWEHRETVGRLLADLGARPLKLREVRASVVGHVLSFLCGWMGWFLPMYMAGKLETKNVEEYDRAAEYADAIGLEHFLPPLRKMAEAEVLHEKYFFEVLGRKPPERRPP
jgi:demethoxyubiquinone hydroxylase (CLK1/Coq7/Cat5 family)